MIFKTIDIQDRSWFYNLPAIKLKFPALITSFCCRTAEERIGHQRGSSEKCDENDAFQEQLSRWNHHKTQSHITFAISAARVSCSSMLRPLKNQEYSFHEHIIPSSVFRCERAIWYLSTTIKAWLYNKWIERDRQITRWLMLARLIKLRKWENKQSLIFCPKMPHYLCLNYFDLDLTTIGKAGAF